MKISTEVHPVREQRFWELFMDGATIYVAVVFDVHGRMRGVIQEIDLSKCDIRRSEYTDGFFLTDSRAGSLQDMGIIPNEYNQHLAFETRGEAAIYRDYVCS